MNKKKLIISIALIAAFTATAFGTYEYNKIQTYNTLVNNANKYMEQGNYDQSITLFNESLQYKDDANVRSSIKLASSLKELKAIYDEGLRLANEKKYNEAIDQFKKITQIDSKLYSNAQQKIQDCKKLQDSLVKQEQDKQTNSIDQQNTTNNQENEKTVPNNSSVSITSNQALQIVANYSGSSDWDVVENTASEGTIVNGSEIIFGHKCYFFVPHGGRAISFIVDKTTGKLYEETDRLDGQNRVYKLVK